MPRAPPEPPSPRMTASRGVFSTIISRRFTAMASAMWRSSARMPGELDTLPRREVGEDFLLRRLEFVLDGFDLRGQVNLLFRRLFLQFIQGLFQFQNGLFEFQRKDSHRPLTRE